MRYFKYIIILILLLICTLLYMQLSDYDNISNSLLNDNIQTKEQMKELTSSVDNIKEKSLELQEKINTLYSIIDEKEIEIEILEENCLQHGTTEYLQTPIEETENPSSIENKEESQITLENENEVTGFE